MTQVPDYDLANLPGAAFRGELNSIIQALASSQSGPEAPTATYPGMLWADTGADPMVLRIRDAADSSWLLIATVQNSFLASFFASGSSLEGRAALELGDLAQNNLADYNRGRASWEEGVSGLYGFPRPSDIAAAIAAQTDVWTEGSVTPTTSGTAFDVTSLPAGIKEIEIHGNGTSLSGTDNFLVQIGTGGSPETSGYLSTSSSITGAVGQATSTNGFVVSGAIASNASYFRLSLKKVPGANDWVAALGGFSSGTLFSLSGGGRVSIAGVLDNFRLTRTGSNTFDAGGFWYRYR